MTILKKQTYVPNDVNESGESSASFEKLVKLYVEFAKSNDYKCALGIKYSGSRGTYELTALPERYSDLESLPSIVNSRDLAVFMSNFSEKSLSLILDMGFRLLSASAESDVVPFFFDDDIFETKLLEALISRQCTAACYAFHDLQSIVVWSLEE